MKKKKDEYMSLKSDEWRNIVSWIDEIVDEIKERNERSNNKTVTLGEQDAVVPLAVLYEWKRFFWGEYDKIRAKYPQAIMDIRRCLIYGENSRVSDIPMTVDSMSVRYPIELVINIRRDNFREEYIYLDIIVLDFGDDFGNPESIDTFCLSREDGSAYEYFREDERRVLLRNYRPEIIQYMIDFIEEKIPDRPYQVRFGLGQTIKFTS